MDLPRKIVRGGFGGVKRLQEELEGEAYLELVVACQLYEESRCENGFVIKGKARSGAGAFLSQRIRWALLKYLERKQEQWERLESLHDAWDGGSTENGKGTKLEMQAQQRELRPEREAMLREAMLRLERVR